jgi:hypothetical protein
VTRGGVIEDDYEMTPAYCTDEVPLDERRETHKTPTTFL